MNGQAVGVCYFGFDFFGGFVSRLVYGRVEFDFFLDFELFLVHFLRAHPRPAHS
jgi:hypothetical protein